MLPKYVFVIVLTWEIKLPSKINVWSYYFDTNWKVLGYAEIYLGFLVRKHDLVKANLLKIHVKIMTYLPLHGDNCQGTLTENIWI